jgi:hypothetical protein
MQAASQSADNEDIGRFVRSMYLTANAAYPIDSQRLDQLEVLDQGAFDPSQTDRIMGAVTRFGGARRLVVGDLLRARWSTWRILPPQLLHRQRPHLDHVAAHASYRHNPTVDVPVHITAPQRF